MPTKARSKTPRTYHHGDLRDALVRSALDILVTEGPEALTLRGVARAAGVSQAAPYRHFADRRALVAAVAEEGFKRLQRAMFGDGESAPSRLGFRDVGLGYVSFGQNNPALYRVMFGPEVARQDDLPSLASTSGAVLDHVRAAIEALQAQKVIAPGDARAIAISVWSMLHGLVMLILDGQTADAGMPTEQLVAETIRIMMFGMAAR
jgi:AcrR family transcriptional regulator